MTLTLNIDENKLQALREKAEREGKSLEKLFEKYVDAILEEGNFSSKNTKGIFENAEMGKDNLSETNGFEGMSPMEVIQELTKNISIPANFDERKDYREHIIKKHA